MSGGTMDWAIFNSGPGAGAPGASCTTWLAPLPPVSVLCPFPPSPRHHYLEGKLDKSLPGPEPTPPRYPSPGPAGTLPLTPRLRSLLSETRHVSDVGVSAGKVF